MWHYTFMSVMRILIFFLGKFILRDYYQSFIIAVWGLSLLSSIQWWTKWSWATDGPQQKSTFQSNLPQTKFQKSECYFFYLLSLLNWQYMPCRETKWSLDIIKSHLKTEQIYISKLCRWWRAGSQETGKRLYGWVKGFDLTEERGGAKQMVSSCLLHMNWSR